MTETVTLAVAVPYPPVQLIAKVVLPERALVLSEPLVALPVLNPDPPPWVTEQELVLEDPQLMVVAVPELTGLGEAEIHAEADGGGIKSNLAFTFLSCVMLTVQVPVPLQPSPDQPTK